jgi:hypothetical protein
MAPVSQTPGAHFTPAGILRIPLAAGTPGQILASLQKILSGLL